MSSEKSDAIILRLIEFSETSLIVTMLTRDFGKITVLAKGARRKKSPFEAALDLLALCRIVFLNKSSGAMGLLTEAKLERRFRAASKDLQRLYSGYYVAELLAKLTDESDPHRELFDLAERTIVSLDEGRHSTFLTLLRFEMRTLALLGHQPMLTRCVRCGNEDSPSEKRTHFGLLDGGRLCDDCRPGRTNVISLAKPSIELLKTMLNENENWETSNLESVNCGEVRQLMNRYVSHLIGQPPRMMTYLRGLV